VYIEDRIKEYTLRHQSVVAARERFADDKELAQWVADVRLQPQAEVKAEVGPLTVNFTADPVSTNRMFAHSNRATKPSKLQGFQNFRREGEQIVNYTVVNTTDTEPESTLIHEEQHAENALLANQKALDELNEKAAGLIEQFTFESNPEVAGKLLERWALIKRELALYAVKDEIIAREKERLVYNVQLTFQKMSSYDFLRETRSFVANQEHIDVATRRMIREKLTTQYLSIIVRSVESFHSLRSVHYLKDEIIAVLDPHKLAVWPKIAKRLIDYQQAQSEEMCNE
jgi:hypothetical protein